MAIAVLLALGLIAYYFWRDLNMSGDISIADLPDVLVENLDFKRTIGDKDWHIVATTAEHNAGVVSAQDLHINIDEQNTGRMTRLRARSGLFTEGSSNAELKSISGHLSFEARSLDIAAPVASYASSDDRWLFSDGVVLSDDETHLTAESAKIESDGSVILEGGAYARWIIK